MKDGMKGNKGKKAGAPPAPAAGGWQGGLVVGSHGRHCVVEADDGRRLICHPRGKRLAAVVGDRVRWLPSGDGGTVEAIEPRRNLLYRQDELRTKSFAANLDQALILLAAEPVFSEAQLARALLACAAAGIAPLVVLNKADLGAAFDRAWQRLLPYRRMGYDVLALAAREGGGHDVENPQMHALARRLHGRATLLLGPSGAGKSTLVNRLAPGAAAQTGEVSHALNSGRHTTTDTRWYWLDAQRSAALIDSPGFQEFGLHHISRTELAALMPDVLAHAGQCRFYNCTHLHEPGCGVRAAVAADADAADAPDSADAAGAAAAAIHPSRYRLYAELFAELPAR